MRSQVIGTRGKGKLSRRAAKDEWPTPKERQAEIERVLHLAPGDLDREKRMLRANIMQAYTIRHMDEFWKREEKKS
jgi:hypothetical protein